MQTPCLLESIREIAPELQDPIDGVKSTVTLAELLRAALALSRALAALIVEQVLLERASEPTTWPACPQCERQLRSKGWGGRQLFTSVGGVTLRRRLGRCPSGCKIGQIAPLDEELGLEPGQRTSHELRSHACLLAVFVPFETVSAILERCIGVKVGASTVWDWVGEAGQRAAQRLEAEIAALHAGQLPIEEVIDARVLEMMAILGADGVMVPFRPNAGSPWGATIWREVKVAVLGRLEHVVATSGTTVARLRQRRLVAVLGDIDALADRLQLEVARQQLCKATQCAWISDGARGFWRLFDQHFAKLATGILDFYHASGQLWEAAMAWYDWQPSAVSWFATARHDLRHGEVQQIVATLNKVATETDRGPDRNGIIRRVANYLSNHKEHLRFPEFHAQELPLGSGFVESAVKWLIQQRFKGVGMRWSENGFNHLLLLRLAWANDRFDSLFDAELSPSPN